MKKEHGKRCLSHDVFIERVSALSPTIKVIGEYVNASTKIEVTCLVDGYTWLAFPSALMRGSGCKICSYNRKRYTHAEYVKALHDVNSDIEIVGEYVGMLKPILARCKRHDVTWSPSANDLLNGGVGCYKCASEKISKSKRFTTEQFLDRLVEIHPTIELLGEYHGVNRKSTVRCNVCGHEWSVQLLNLLAGHGCKKCSDKRLGDLKRKSHDKFIEDLSAVNPNILICSEYWDSHTRIQAKCLKCGREWTPMPVDLLNGSGCPSCALSKGEALIERVLNSQNVSYEPQYAFPDCKYKHVLRFDFFVPSKNTAIEYQGEQHYEPVDYSGRGKEWARKQLELLKIRDQIKRDYCAANNICLVEIPYWETKNISEIIASLLSAA